MTTPANPDDLTSWLRAQLDDDERAARAWLPLGNPTAAERDHIARHDPARVLAEVDAKRRILDRHVLKQGERQRICAECGGRDWKPDGRVLHPFPWVMPWPCPTLRLLALPYADRPGYRSEWAPA